MIEHSMLGNDFIDMWLIKLGTKLTYKYGAQLMEKLAGIYEFIDKAC